MFAKQAEIPFVQSNAMVVEQTVQIHQPMKMLVLRLAINLEHKLLDHGFSELLFYYYKSINFVKDIQLSPMSYIPSLKTRGFTAFVVK